MKSYLKFLSRNKLYTAIEFIGLAVSLAFVIIIGSYVWQQYAVTRENPDGNRIYLPGLPDYPGLTYGFPGVVTEIPDIEKVAMLCPVGLPYKDGEVLYGAGVDRSFFDMFPNYHFVEGDADVISSDSNVIVSESFARRNDISVGDNIKLGENELNVGAILKDPDGTVFQYYEVNDKIPTPSEVQKAFKERMSGILPKRPEPEKKKREQKPKEADMFVVFDEFTRKCGEKNAWTIATFEKMSALKADLQNFGPKIKLSELNEDALTKFVGYLRDEKKKRPFR